jgi:hypothetical protein
MSTERDPRCERPLPGFEPATADGVVPVPGLGRAPGTPETPEGRAVRARTDGLRRVRRVSNWTAAALIVGTGAATVALAHNTLPVAPGTFPSSTTGTTATGVPGTSHGANGPQVSHSVVTTSASGVTTTTTQLPNGKTVVTHSGHASGYHDN